MQHVCSSSSLNFSANDINVDLHNYVTIKHQDLTNERKSNLNKCKCNLQRSINDI